MSWEQAQVGIPTAVAAIVVAAIVNKRSRHVDKTAADIGVTAESRAGTQQLVDNLQNDNKVIRAEAREAAAEARAMITELHSKLDTCLTIQIEMRDELARLRRKYGENGET